VAWPDEGARATSRRGTQTALNWEEGARQLIFRAECGGLGRTWAKTACLRAPCAVVRVGAGPRKGPAAATMMSESELRGEHGSA